MNVLLYSMYNNYNNGDRMEANKRRNEKNIHLLIQNLRGI